MVAMLTDLGEEALRLDHKKNFKVIKKCIGQLEKNKKKFFEQYKMEQSDYISSIKNRGSEQRINIESSKFMPSFDDAIEDDNGKITVNNLDDDSDSVSS